MTVRDIITCLEDIAPLSYQESYDNAGLIIGAPESRISSVLIAVDITEDVIDEAVKNGAGLIISHHPLIFGGLKSITGSNYVERCIIKAIKKDIAIYASHTNLDNVSGGVNLSICRKLDLKNCRVLKPREDELRKLVTFIPADHAPAVREAVFGAGAGHIGAYDCCSYNVEGRGSFRASESSNPFVGEKGRLHYEDEVRFETVFPKNIMPKVIQALTNAHPYEEVAYDIYPLENKYMMVGSGMIGETAKATNEDAFLNRVKKIFGTGCIRHTGLRNRKIKTIAVCGGAGSFLVKEAISSGADIFLTSDIKYHDFFNAEDKIIIADIGHYESERYSKDIFYEILNKKFPNFAFHLSKINTNPINYL